METDTVSTQEIQERQSEEGSSHNTKLANTVLVATSTANYKDNTDGHTIEQDLELDRLAIIQQYQNSQELSTRVVEYIREANRSSTRKNYDQAWSKWTQWCRNKSPVYSPIEYSPEHLVDYLVDCQQLSYSTLNGYRSAIASVFRIIHPQKPPIASHPLVLHFFEAKRRRETRLPNTSKEIFDVTLLIDHVLTWGSNNSLSLYNLQLKTVLLITIATMWRPRSDIGNIQFRDVHSMMDNDKNIPIGVTLTARQPKEIKAKMSKIGTIEDRDKCPVHTLWVFCQATKKLRNHLTEGHKLFLTNLEDRDQTKWQSVQPIYGTLVKIGSKYESS
ncbi:hypothetical protein G6F37_013169 [Rhizopus arrhizus]|nr:hypothetical protein G6F38_013105 [Rhizopus arrhizus]KAG1139364.1 hypothetical protein G6F37_013169 [Rhizopus arrhizus]